ncbi:hypothetical protein Tco_0462064 [Tanacetum coccineum]
MITKPSIYLKSPFMNKMIKTQEKLDKDEILCARSIFCMQGDINEVVFDDGKGTIANRSDMQSLATGITVQKQTIDTFVIVLNYEERIRSGGKDKMRHYFLANVVTAHLLNKEKDEAKDDKHLVLYIPLLSSSEAMVSYFDDLDYFKDFDKEFPAIVYNDALTSKLDFLTEPTLSPQHINEFDLKDETSLSECDKEEQNVL